MAQFFRSRAAVSLGIGMLAVAALIFGAWQQLRLQQAVRDLANAGRMTRLPSSAIDLDVELGHSLLFDKHDPEAALLYLQRAQRRGSRSAILPYLLAESIRHGGGHRWTLRGHRGALTSIALTNDGTRVVTASADRTARIYDTRSGQPTAELAGHSGAILSVALSPGADRVVTTSADGTARVHEAQSGRLITELRGHTSAVTSACFCPDSKHVVTLGSDRTVRSFDLAGNVTVLPLSPALPSAARLLGFSGSGALLATLAEPDRLAVFALSARDAQTPKIEYPSLAPSEVVSTVFSPQDSRVLQISEQGYALIFSLTQGTTEAIARIQAPLGDAILAAAFFPDDHTVVTGHKSGAVRLWRIGDGRGNDYVSWDSAEELAVFLGHSGPVTAVAAGADGLLFASASQDGTARLWERPRRQPQYQLRASVLFDGGNLQLAFRPDGRQLAVIGTGLPGQPEPSDENTIQLYDAGSGRFQRELRGHTHLLREIVYSPSGDRLYSQNSDGTTWLWDLTSGQRRPVLGGSNYPGAKFSSDGRLLLARMNDASFAVAEAQSDKPLFTIGNRQAPVTHAMFSRDGRHVVIHRAGAIRLIAVDGPSHGTEIRRIPTPDLPESTSLELPDDRRVILLGPAGAPHIFDLVLGQRLRYFADGTLGAKLYFGPQARYVLGSEPGGFSVLWDVDTGSSLHLLPAADNATFSPDGQRLATVSDRVRIWDVQSGRLLAIFQAPPDAAHLHGTEWSPDGRFLLIYSQSIAEAPTSSLLVFDVSPETRSPQDLDALVRCRMRYRFARADSLALVPGANDPSACRPFN